MLCLVAQSCPTLCDSMDCSPPGSSIHGDSPGKNTGVGCHVLLQGIFPTQGSNPSLLHCRWFFTIWATREAYQPGRLSSKNPQIVNAGYLPSLSVGCKLVQTLWRTVWRVHKKLKTRVSIWCCNPIPGHIFGEKTWSKSIYVPPMLIEGLFTMATLFHLWKYFVDFHFSKAENLCLDDIFSPFFILLQILNF